MGIWDWVSSASDKVKQNAPGLTRGSEGTEMIKRLVTEVVVPEILRYTSIPGAVQTFRIFWENSSSSSVHDRKKYEYVSKELEKMKKGYEELKEDVENIKKNKAWWMF